MLQFTQSLKNGPFHVRLLTEGSEGGGGLSQAAGGTTGHWMSSLSRTQPLVSSSRGTNNFYLKGVIQ